MYTLELPAWTHRLTPIASLNKVYYIGVCVASLNDWITSPNELMQPDERQLRKIIVHKTTEKSDWTIPWSHYTFPSLHLWIADLPHPRSFTGAICLISCQILKGMFFKTSKAEITHTLRPGALPKQPEIPGGNEMELKFSIRKFRKLWYSRDCPLFPKIPVRQKLNG